MAYFIKMPFSKGFQHLALILFIDVVPQKKDYENYLPPSNK